MAALNRFFSAIFDLLLRPFEGLSPMWGLVPLLRTRGYTSLPVHFLGKAATFNLLYAFPLLLLGDGEGVVARLAEVFGWAFAIWGVGLYWWAGVLYAWQTYKLLSTTEPRKTSAQEA